jgi:lipoyl(octanoyl) transferase
MTIHWHMEKRIISYPVGIRAMNHYAHLLRQEKVANLIWGLQHDHVYTMGIRGEKKDFLFPVSCMIHQSKRGGQTTYHGPGQLIIYPIIRLKDYDIYPTDYVHYLQKWCCKAIASFGITPILIDGRIGVFVNSPTPHKLISIGIHISRGITTHGISINVHNDLNFFKSITPCGIQEASMCSFSTLGQEINIEEVFDRFKKHWFLCWFFTILI